MDALLERDGEVLRVRTPMLIPVAGTLLAAGRAQLDGVKVVDLAEVPEVDSSALTVLLAWMRDAAHSGRSLSVRHPPAALSSLATLYGVAELLPLA